jgi:hypothetical protein
LNERPSSFFTFLYSTHRYEPMRDAAMAAFAKMAARLAARLRLPHGCLIVLNSRVSSIHSGFDVFSYRALDRFASEPIVLTKLTISRRRTALLIRSNAAINLSPSGLETNSSIWA